MVRMAVDTRHLEVRRGFDRAERQAGLLGVFGAFCFLVVAIYVVLLGRADLDTTVREGLRSAGAWIDPYEAYWVEHVARDLAPIGGLTLLGLVVGVAVAHVLLSRGWNAAALLLVALGGGVLVTVFLKLVFGRGVGLAFSPQWFQMFSASFPSANAVLSSMVYPTLGAVLAVIYGSRLVGAFLIGCAALATVLIGISRIFLGMHLPTDVLAGWSAGLCWASLCWIVIRRTRGWGRLE